jgi:hypothetical protein
MDSLFGDSKIGLCQYFSIMSLDYNMLAKYLLKSYG